jgi:hypothetical protein
MASQVPAAPGTGHAVQQATERAARVLPGLRMLLLGLGTLVAGLVALDRAGSQGHAPQSRWTGSAAFCWPSPPSSWPA